MDVGTDGSTKNEFETRIAVKPVPKEMVLRSVLVRDGTLSDDHLLPTGKIHEDVVSQYRQWYDDING